MITLIRNPCLYRIQALPDIHYLTGLKEVFDAKKMAGTNLMRVAQSRKTR